MKTLLRNSVASCAITLATGLALSAQASAQGGSDTGSDFTFRNDITPYYGDINPFYGDINPFYGDINPFYGDISPFWGDISPFWGDINPFYGDIDPFYGDISPFYGDIHPFWGDINPFYGDINPFYGDIGPFWGDIGPFWGDINAFWSEMESDGSLRDYTRLANQLTSMLERTVAVFDPMAQDQLGTSLREAFLDDMLANFGIDPTDPASLANIDAETRSRFFVDFYDGLMGLSGTDRIDHWMATANWTPALSQAANFGRGAKVGIVDFGFTSQSASNDLYGSHVRTGGSDEDSSFYHGAAVVSLLASAHDGNGLMGIVPDATFALFNPFDESLTTNWSAVEAGIVAMTHGGADVLNISLGVSGWTLHDDWQHVLANRTVAHHGADTVFVIAAGNDGLTQTQDLNWDSGAMIENLILVGSVDPMGGISSFSNRPGEACINVGGQCSDGNRLMDRFLVAPGEMILMSDGEGGLARHSGTSFAAPIVTGAAALVRSQWSWLGAPDVADILFSSARDLGEPGTDAVYGRGLLDITAAMSPLDYSQLYQVNSHGQRVYAGEMGMETGQLSFDTPDANHITVFEDINDQARDFLIEVESVTTGRGRNRHTEVYLAERVVLSTSVNGSGKAKFADTGEISFAMPGFSGTQVSIIGARLDPHDHLLDGELPFQAGIEIAQPETGHQLRFGLGEGALAMSQQDGFGLFSDFRPETGGVNPVLGFASGGAYGLAGFGLGERTRLTFGATQTDEEDVYVDPFSGEERASLPGMASYQAQALNVGVDHALNDALSLMASYTLLNEQTGLLGAQGAGSLALEGGALTDAATMGLEADVTGLRLSASATWARTRTTAFDGDLFSLPDDVMSSAYQIAVARDGLFSARDAMRVSLIQPLYVETGRLDYTATRVSDRESGTLGVQTDSWELGGVRPTYAELLYRTPLGIEYGEVSVFTRFELSGHTFSEDDAGLMSGLQYAVRF